MIIIITIVEHHIAMLQRRSISNEEECFTVSITKFYPALRYLNNYLQLTEHYWPLQRRLSSVWMTNNTCRFIDRPQ